MGHPMNSNFTFVAQYPSVPFGLESYTHPHWLKFYPLNHHVHLNFAIFIFLIMVMSIVGNSLVAFVYFKHKKLNRSIRSYVILLSILDAVSPAATYWMGIVSSFKGAWYFGKFGCSIYGGIQGLCSILSIALIAQIAFERALSITVPLFYRSLMTRVGRIHLRILFGLWCYSFIVTMPPVFGWSAYRPTGLLSGCCFEFMDRDFASRSFFIYLFVLGLGVPVAVLICSYSIISHQIISRELKRKRSSNTSYTNPLTVSDRQRLSKIRVGKLPMITVVFLVFAFSWFPYSVVSLVGQFGPTDSIFTHPYAVAIANAAAKSSTVYNPLIYAFADRVFRSAFQKTILRSSDGCKCCYRRSRKTVELSRLPTDVDEYFSLRYGSGARGRLLTNHSRSTLNSQSGASSENRRTKATNHHRPNSKSQNRQNRLMMQTSFSDPDIKSSKSNTLTVPGQENFSSKTIEKNKKKSSLQSDFEFSDSIEMIA